jgi:hypothetical protein
MERKGGEGKAKKVGDGYKMVTIRNLEELTHESDKA